MNPRNQAVPDRPARADAARLRRGARLPARSSELSALIRGRQVTSTELTKLYLDRLKRFDPLLKCVVTLTEDLALKQAAKADAEIAAGRLSRPAAWHPLGRKGPDRLSRLSHHMGSHARSRIGVIDEQGHRGLAARRGRRGDAGEALARGARNGRPAGSAARPAARGTLARGSSGSSAGSAAAARPAWSVSRSAARRSAASSPPAAPAAPRACDPPSVASAATAA